MCYVCDDERIEKENKMTILEEAAELVDGDRQQDYGHPIENHTRTAKMWSVLLDVEVTAEQVCLCMTLQKISRQCHKPKRDNLVDGCGWLRNVEMIEETREHDEIDEEVRGRKKEPEYYVGLRAFLGVILKRELREPQRERLVELFDLCYNSTDSKERVEIMEVITEIMFGKVPKGSE